MIPLCDARQQYLDLKDDIDAAMQEVASRGQYILGPNVKQLERDIADDCQCEYGIGVGSGTDALHLVLRALNIGPGDEVITTPFTFVATTEAIGIVGAKPVFVDTDPRTFNIDVTKIEAAITPQTKAILPVHLYGQPCDMDPIMDIARRHGLRVVEDCAQAIGATYNGQKVGSIGDAGCLSFFPSKNLGCFGDGGMVVTRDEQLYKRVEMLRRHGGKVKYHHSELGVNSRLDELQAAILRVKRQHLDTWNSQRREHAYRYNASFANTLAIATPLELKGELAVSPASPEETPADATCVYHQYTIRTSAREHFVSVLQEAEIGCAVYYPVPLHLQEVHASLGHSLGDFPHAEQAAAECLSLPMYPQLSAVDQEQVVKQLLHAVETMPAHPETDDQELRVA